MVWFTYKNVCFAWESIQSGQFFVCQVAKNRARSIYSPVVNHKICDTFKVRTEKLGLRRRQRTNINNIINTLFTLQPRHTMG